MKPLVIYHDNCADGFGATFVAWLKLHHRTGMGLLREGILRWENPTPPAPNRRMT